MSTQEFPNPKTITIEILFETAKSYAEMKNCVAGITGDVSRACHKALQEATETIPQPGLSRQAEINNSVYQRLTGHDGTFTSFNDRIDALIARVEDLENRESAIHNLLVGQKQLSSQITALQESAARHRERIHKLESFDVRAFIIDHVKLEFRKMWEETRKAIPNGQIVYDHAGVPMGCYIDDKIEKDVRLTMAKPEPEKSFEPVPIPTDKRIFVRGGNHAICTSAHNQIKAEDSPYAIDWMASLGFHSIERPGIQWYKFNNADPIYENQAVRADFACDHLNGKWYFNHDQHGADSYWQEIVPPATYQSARDMIAKWQFSSPPEKRNEGTSITPPEPWELAKAEVLAKYPDAKAAISRNEHDKQRWAILDSTGKTLCSNQTCEENAWEVLANHIKNPTPSTPTPSIWSREIPSESGWYWWRCHDVCVESDHVAAYVHPNGFTTIQGVDTTRFAYPERFKDASFGPRIPSAETLAQLPPFIHLCYDQYEAIWMWGQMQGDWSFMPLVVDLARAFKRPELTGDTECTVSPF